MRLSGGRVRRELQQLPADRPHRQRRNPFDIDLPRPASGRDDNVMRGHRRIVVEMDADVAVSMLDALRARGHSHPRAVLDGGGRQRSGQIGGDDKPVRLHEQRAGHLGRQLRFRLARRLLVEQLALETGRARVGGDVLQLVERLIGGDDLQRSGAPIPDADARIARHAIDERVVHLEAFRRERQQRPAESFEVRHEHACGGLRRSQARRRGNRAA